ncbi:hypothetical protein [Paenibacillus sp. FSL H7-0357]|uniref:hypothetical protein n=1 Tax=Paenibacillus sp. FSL H7-0357 TaxID=1536774 RepID=UPI003FA59B54
MGNTVVYSPYHGSKRSSSWNGTEIMDYGKKPFVINIEQVTKLNNTFRTALWSGEYFQVTVMSIPVGDDIGLEVHPHTDQFIRIEEGQGLVQMGDLVYVIYAPPEHPTGTIHVTKVEAMVSH